MNDPAFLFKLYNLLALVAWLPLFIFPYHKNTLRYISGFKVPLFFALSYLIFLVITFITSDTPVSFNNMESVTALFAGKWGMLTGWVHYLCFDFIIGGFIIKAGFRAGLPRWVVIFSLLFTFLLGPFGLLVFKMAGWLKRPVKLY